VLEWSGGEKETMEEGCLSLPGVHVDVERPTHVRVRAQDASGEPILIEATGLEARVIQHEMDHLDGVLPRSHAARSGARRHADPPRAASRPLEHRLPGHLGLRGRRPARLAATDHRPALVVTRPDRAAGRGRKLTPPPVAVAPRAIGLDLFHPSRITPPRWASGWPRPARTSSCSVRFGALVKEPLADDFEISTSIRRFCRAGAARRPSSAPSWRRRETGVGDHASHRPGSTPARSASRRPSRSARRRLRDAGRAPRGARGRPAGARARRAPAVRRAAEEGVTYAEKITAADRTLDPAAPAEVNVRIVRALHPHIGARLPLDDGTFLGVRRARRRRGRARSSCSRSSRRAGRPMAYADYLRGHAAR
jgi:methionyl-tRNA formyltransferase